MYDDVVEDPYEDTGGKDTVALTGVENIYFPEMRDWVKEHVADAAKKKVVASDTEENMLLADVIEVINLLVKYGYYDDSDDVEAVLRPLLDVLNGFTDLPFPLTNKTKATPHTELPLHLKTDGGESPYTCIHVCISAIFGDIIEISCALVHLYVYIKILSECNLMILTRRGDSWKRLKTSQSLTSRLGMSIVNNLFVGSSFDLSPYSIMEVIDLFFNFRLYVRLQVSQNAHSLHFD